MRLHTLSLTAFGPFADTQRVDFDALGDGGLFLFHGPTGAGKTSVLDAVCFAFYGQVPGARQQARSLRSDHAAPGTRPEVVLEATVRGRRLRVTRSPQWDRPKHRGTGTTTEQARVLLEELDGRLGPGWQTLSTRLDEAGQLLGRLLGLSLSQFCQVALLPQGQFAEFLRADADRRRDLLESLFDTERFAAAEAWLVERRRETARALDEADQALTALLARVAEASGEERDPAEVDPATAAEWAGDLAARSRLQLADHEAAEAEARGAREQADSALRAARALAEAQARQAELAARLAGLEAQADRRAAVAAEIEAARQAAPVLPLVARLGSLEQRLAEATSVVRRRADGLAEAAPATGTDGGRTARDLLGQVGSLRAELGVLGRLLDDEDEAERLVREVDGLEQAVVALDTQTTAVEGWLSAEPETRQRLRAERDAARDAAGGLAAARDRHGQAAARLDAARRRDARAAEVADRRTALAARVDAAQSAREHWLDLRQRRLDGMAAELAAALQPGAACPVCGSDEHPEPAAPSAEAVTREDETRAELAAAAAADARMAAQQELADVEVELAQCREAAGGDTGTAELAAGLAALDEEVARLTAAAERLAGAETALGELDAEQERQTRERVRLAAEGHALRERIDGHQRRLALLRAEVDAARGDDPSIRRRAARLERLASDYEALAQAIADQDRLRAELDEAARQTEAEAAGRGLPDLAAVAAAARDEGQLHALEDYRQRHDAELAAVRELLGDPALAAAAAAPPARLDETTALAARAEQEHAAAVGALDAARRRVQALDRLSAELSRLLDRRAPLAARHATVDRLSRLAEGKSSDNRLRMSLSAYVLAARLEQVAEAASERLVRMSSGRYSLLHTAAGATGRSRGGLHLRVLDAWTGAERDPATLSGGESFSASLALALGLADVVTAEAGGSLLETLFVDEGFGSLDEDTLDEVMDVLDGLRDGGRVVGIVSHVADLRQRVPVQLRIDKGRTGSVIRQSAPAAPGATVDG